MPGPSPTSTHTQNPNFQFISDKQILTTWLALLYVGFGRMSCVAASSRFKSPAATLSVNANLPLPGLNSWS